VEASGRTRTGSTKHLLHYIRGATDLCLTFGGDWGKRIILAIWGGRLVTVRGHALLLNRCPRPTASTTLICGWPLSASTSLPFLSYSPYSLGLTFQPTSTTTNPYADNHLPTAVSSVMPPLSSVPAENYARPVDVASIRVVSSSRADRSALSAAIPPLLGRGAFACAHTVQDIAG
jgi:hypothetical protein